MDTSHVFTTFPVLETARCTLRAIAPHDAQAILAILGNAEVTRYLGRPPMTSLDDAARRIQVYRITYEDQTGIPWGVVDRASGQFIGTCVLWRLDRGNFRAELGYLLNTAWWGRGVATEAAHAVLDFGFERLDLHSVEAQTAPDNQASRRVLEKLGFVQEGYFRENYYDTASGTFTDTAVFSLLKSVWLRRPEIPPETPA